MEGLVSPGEPGDDGACVLAVKAEAQRGESGMDAPADEAGDPAVAMHENGRVLLLWCKGRMVFCTQPVELNEVILGGREEDI